MTTKFKAINFMVSYAKGLTNPFSIKHRDLILLCGKKEFKGKEATVLIIWKGRQTKPFVHKYSYLEENIIKLAHNRMEQADARFYQKEKEKKERKNFTPEFEVGDVFVASWGYGQTNVDAYQVTEKVSKHYCKLAPIALESVPGTQGMDCENVKPIKDAFLGEDHHKFEKINNKRYKVGKFGIKMTSYAYARKWDGKKHYYNSWYY